MFQHAVDPLGIEQPGPQPVFQRLLHRLGSEPFAGGVGDQLDRRFAANRRDGPGQPAEILVVMVQVGDFVVMGVPNLADQLGGRQPRPVDLGLTFAVDVVGVKMVHAVGKGAHQVVLGFPGPGFDERRHPRAVFAGTGAEHPGRRDPPGPVRRQTIRRKPFRQVGQRRPGVGADEVDAVVLLQLGHQRGCPIDQLHHVHEHVPEKSADLHGDVHPGPAQLRRRDDRQLGLPGRFPRGSNPQVAEHLPHSFAPGLGRFEPPENHRRAFRISAVKPMEMGQGVFGDLPAARAGRLRRHQPGIELVAVPPGGQGLGIPAGLPADARFGEPALQGVQQGGNFPAGGQPFFHLQGPGQRRGPVAVARRRSRLQAVPHQRQCVGFDLRQQVGVDPPAGSVGGRGQQPVMVQPPLPGQHPVQGGNLAPVVAQPGAQRFGPLFGGKRLVEHVESPGDQGAFHPGQGFLKPGDVVAGEMKGFGGRTDFPGHPPGPIGIGRFRLQVLGDPVFQVGVFGVQPGDGHRRGIVVHHRGQPAPLGDHGLGRVDHVVDVKMGNRPHEPDRETVRRRQPRLLAFQKFQGAVGSHVDHGVGPELGFQPAIEGVVLVMGRQSFVVGDALGIGMDAPGRLESQKDVFQLQARQNDLPLAGHDLARGRSPAFRHRRVRGQVRRQGLEPLRRQRDAFG